MVEDPKYSVWVNNANSNYGTVTVSKSSAYAGEYIRIYSHSSNGFYQNCNVTGVGTVTEGFYMPAQNVTVTSYFEGYGTQYVSCTVSLVESISGGRITFNGRSITSGSSTTMTLRSRSNYSYSYTPPSGASNQFVQSATASPRGICDVTGRLSGVITPCWGSSVTSGTLHIYAEIN